MPRFGWVDQQRLTGLIQAGCDSRDEQPAAPAAMDAPLRPLDTMGTMVDKTQTESFTGPSRRLASGAVDACLVFIHGPQLGRLVELDGDSLTLGRDEGCDVVVEGMGVSRRHCRIRRRADGYSVEDLGSTNGTRVNDEIVETTDLADCDLISIGDAVLKFVGERSVEARYHSELHDQIARDHLTELLNQRAFESVLGAEVVRAVRYERALSLVMMDLDHFKSVNDAYGHPAGDAVLRQVADVLRSRARGGDNLFRIGGEELALILPETALTTATGVAESFRRLVESTRFAVGEATIQVTISLGVAAWGAGMERPVELVELADRRLYQAKSLGRNRVEPPPS
jgi:two-component system, cell cycle response regulator